MKDKCLVYPVVIRKTDDTEVPYYVRIPDFEVSTQGEDLADAIFMARDLLCCVASDYEEEGKALPEMTDIKEVERLDEDIVTLVEADFEEYKKLQDTKAVRKNVSLPAGLSYRAEKAGLSLSYVLQTALKNELKI